MLRLANCDPVYARFTRSGGRTLRIRRLYPPSEYSALEDLYISTGGSQWIDNKGGLDPSARFWTGVAVTDHQCDQTGHVYAIFLDGNRLTGSLPSSLSQLSQLRRLSLYGNQLTGSIPSSLGQLSQLGQFYLDHNFLTVSIPSSLGQLSQLGQLYLDHNQLTGSLPMELGQLTQLFFFTLNYNCLSLDDPTSQNVIETLQNAGVVVDYLPQNENCEATLIGLEVTQGVQDLENSVRLVEHKKTFVRAHVKNPSAISASASLTAKDIPTGNILGTIPNANIGGQITIRDNPRRAALNDSFLFEVPDHWRRGRVEFSFAGNGVPFAGEAGGEACKKVTVTFQPLTSLSMKFVSLTWKGHTPAPEDVTQVKNEFLGRYPISYLESVTGATQTNSNPCLGDREFDSILGLLNNMRHRDCSGGGVPKKFYQGLLADFGACFPRPRFIGLADDIPGFTSAVFVNTGFISAPIHEQGHVLGLKHTAFLPPPDTEECDPAPCTRLEGDGTLSLDKAQYIPTTVYGFDVNNSDSRPPNHKIYPAETADFMSYGNPSWPSQANYEELFDKITMAGSPCENGRFDQNEVLADQTVIIDGKIQFDGPAGQIGSVIVNTTSATISLPSPGDYSIRMEDSQGAELGRFSFNPLRGSGEGGFSTGVISLLLPGDPNAKRIVLLHNEDVLDSRQASANSPTVNVTFPNGGEVLNDPSAIFSWTAADPDGDPLSYTLEYSADNGTTWQTLAINWNSESFSVDVTKLHGTTLALARVTASDGFNCTQAQSQGTFTVPDHAPTADVSSPEDNRLYVGEQMIILEGTGSDVEDGALDGSRLTWTSDLNGPIGTGTSLAINAMSLQEGTHTITLTATDSTNHTGSASISIRIFRTRPPLPATLSVSPGGLTFRLARGQTATQTVAIRNEGDGDLEWSASADQPWIHLESASGSTPYNLDIMVDATGLPVGEYSGQVTIDAPGALGGPQVVAVNLRVQPRNTTPRPRPTPHPRPTPRQ